MQNVIPRLAISVVIRGHGALACPQPRPARSRRVAGHRPRPWAVGSGCARRTVRGRDGCLCSRRTFWCGRRCPVRAGMGNAPQPAGRHAWCNGGIPACALRCRRTRSGKGQAASSTGSSLGWKPRGGASSPLSAWCRSSRSTSSTMRWASRAFPLLPTFWHRSCACCRARSSTLGSATRVGKRSSKMMRPFAMA